jgi:hypothetical protein
MNLVKDLHTADRQRPSHEQVASQKGTGMAAMLLKSALADMPDAKENAILVVNLAGYVEVCCLKAWLGQHNKSIIL